MSVNRPAPKVLPLTPRNSFCPQAACPNRGQTGRGNIVIHSQREHRYKCITCGKTFAATRLKCEGERQAMALAVESRLWLERVVSAVRDQALIIPLVARVRASVAALDGLVCVDGLRSYMVAVTRAFRVKLPRHGRRGDAGKCWPRACSSGKW